MVECDSCKECYHRCQSILPGVRCPVTNGSAQCKSKIRAKNRFQIAQSPTREAKLVILPYRALKKTQNRTKKIPKADAAEKQIKCEKSKQDIAKEFKKNTSPYHAKNWTLEGAIAFRFLGQQQVNSHSSISEFSSVSAKKRAVRKARQGILTKQETKTLGLSKFGNPQITKTAIGKRRIA